MKSNLIRFFPKTFEYSIKNEYIQLFHEFSLSAKVSILFLVLYVNCCIVQPF